MLRLSFNPGKHISLFNKTFQIVSTDQENRFTLLGQDNIQHVKPLSFLMEQYSQGNLRPAPVIANCRIPEKRVSYKPIGADASDKAKKRAYIVSLFLSRLDEEGVPLSQNSILLKAAIAQISKDLDLKSIPHTRTVLRWQSRRLHQDDTPAAFVPLYAARGGRGKPRFAAEVIATMDKAIDEIFLNSSCQNRFAAYKDFRQEIADRNEFFPASKQLTIPSYNSFSRHIDRRSQYEIFAARHGRIAAEKKFRKTGLAPAVVQILERVEIDHTPLDLFVVDRATGLPLGRPRLTIALDKASRSILGFDIGFTGNSAQAALNCLKHAILPKDYVKSRYPSIQSDWPMYGLPATVAVDNGKEFHSQSFQEALRELSISLFYCPSYAPNWKGSVERFLKTIAKDLLATLPGASLGHFYERVGDKHPKDLAVIDMERLQEIIHSWIVDVYHNTMHRGIRSTPHAAWSARRSFINVELPAVHEDLNRICCEITTRSIFHYGLELHGARSFNNDQLQEIRRVFEKNRAVKVRVRWNDERLSHCWVEDPRTGEWFMVPNVDPHTHDLSREQLYMLNKVIRHAKAHGEKLCVVEARRKIRDLAQALLQSKRMRDRKRALDLLGATDGDSANTTLIPLDSTPKSSQKKHTRRKSPQKACSVNRGKKSSPVEKPDDDFPDPPNTGGTPSIYPKL